MTACRLHPVDRHTQLIKLLPAGGPCDGEDLRQCVASALKRDPWGLVVDVSGLDSLDDQLVHELGWTRRELRRNDVSVIVSCDRSQRALLRRAGFSRFSALSKSRGRAQAKLFRGPARRRARARCEERSALATFLAEVEVALARADTHAALDDFEHALRWLATGEQLCGGLTPGYLAKRVEWGASLTRQQLS